MKMKIILLLTIILVVFCIILTGCGERTIEKETEPETYFVKISSEYCGDIVYDSRTKVQYWRSMGSYSSGVLTMLVDADGNPLLYEE